jgi:hypothetical protein
MGACPGNEESAGVNCSHRCPKDNRQMRRVLNQAANAAVKAKRTIFTIRRVLLICIIGTYRLPAAVLVATITAVPSRAEQSPTAHLTHRV